MFNSKAFVVEFLGTFALIFIGAGAGMVGAGLIGTAMAFGLTLAVFFHAYGHISGAHFNPAVTFAHALNSTIRWGQVLFYWVAQFAGAVLAAWLLHTIATLLGGTLEAAATVGMLTVPQPVLALVVEVLLTFFFISMILQSSTAGPENKATGWVLGAALAFTFLGGGSLTGASINPARTFSIAIFSKPSFTSVYTYVIYLFGPLIGATLAVLVYNFLDDIVVAGDQEEELEPPP